jgi:hypothetical protein
MGKSGFEIQISRHDCSGLVYHEKDRNFHDRQNFHACIGFCLSWRICLPQSHGGINIHIYTYIRGIFSFTKFSLCTAISVVVVLFSRRFMVMVCIVCVWFDTMQQVLLTALIRGVLSFGFSGRTGLKFEEPKTRRSRYSVCSKVDTWLKLDLYFQIVIMEFIYRYCSKCILYVLKYHCMLVKMFCEKKYCKGKWRLAEWWC